MFTQGVYYKFGRNVFVISLIRRLLAVLLIAIALIFIQVFAPIGSIVGYIFLGIFLYAVATVVSAWYDYVYHQFKLDEYALVIRSGVMNQREVAIPYRQIQNVDMNTNYLEDIFGVSELFILTSGSEDRGTEGKKEETSAVFPLISHVYAVELQQELMKRASVQLVTADRGAPIINTPASGTPNASGR
ncbi:MAG: PH domain-containing protein [bacterium]